MTLNDLEGSYFALFQRIY